MEMERLPRGVFHPGTAERVLFLARRYLAGRERLFSARLDAGRACDGHGDLLAEDIFCLDDGPRVLDCIDFDDRLRYGDVLNDVAFLAMDLERLGRPDLSRRFLELYREFTGDSWPASLAHHYVAYRAQVRALVAGIRLAQAGGSSPEAARHLLALSADPSRAGPGPTRGRRRGSPGPASPPLRLSSPTPSGRRRSDPTRCESS